MVFIARLALPDSATKALYKHVCMHWQEKVTDKWFQLHCSEICDFAHISK